MSSGVKGAEKHAVVRGGRGLFHLFLKWETLEYVFMLMELIGVVFLSPLSPQFHLPTPYSHIILR